MEEGGTELEAEAEEGELEGPVRRTHAKTWSWRRASWLEEGELAGPAEEGSTELEAEAEEGELEEGELVEEGELAGQRSWRPLSLTLCLRFLNRARR